MLKNLATGIATIALIGSTASVFADATSDNSGTITIQATVDPIVAVSVVDDKAGIASTAAFGSATINSLTRSANTTDVSSAAQMASFRVQANVNYGVEVGAVTWVPSSIDTSSTEKLVKFSGLTTTTNFMGGELFLVKPDGSNTVDWDTSAGKVISTGLAGTDNWKLGAVFLPDYAGNNGNPNGVSGLIAPQDDYQATVTVLVSVST